MPAAAQQRFANKSGHAPALLLDAGHRFPADTVRPLAAECRPRALRMLREALENLALDLSTAQFGFGSGNNIGVFDNIRFNGYITDEETVLNITTAASQNMVIDGAGYVQFQTNARFDDDVYAYFGTSDGSDIDFGIRYDTGNRRLDFTRIQSAAPTGTLGNWFRAAGYDTHYDGKWHITHADLHGEDGEPLATNTAAGEVLVSRGEGRIWVGAPPETVRPEVTASANGLRPARYVLTKDRHITIASEIGVYDYADKDVVGKGRLGPGEMLAVDLVNDTRLALIPVPAPVWLFGFGLVGLIGIARRNTA